MDATRQELAAHFELLNDGELLSEFQSADLTESAKAVAAEELRRRGIDIPRTPTEPTESEEAPDDPVIEGDLVILDRVSTPAEAHMLRGRLELRNPSDRGRRQHGSNSVTDSDRRRAGPGAGILSRTCTGDCAGHQARRLRFG
jgi:hypothetical protein